MDTTVLNNLMLQAQNDLETIKKRTQSSCSWQDFILRSSVERQVKLVEFLQLYLAEQSPR